MIMTTECMKEISQSATPLISLMVGQRLNSISQYAAMELNFIFFWLAKYTISRIMGELILSQSKVDDGYPLRNGKPKVKIVWRNEESCRFYIILFDNCNCRFLR